MLAASTSADLPKVGQKNPTQLIGNLPIIITHHVRIHPERESRIRVPKTILSHTHGGPQPIQHGRVAVTECVQTSTLIWRRSRIGCST